MGGPRHVVGIGGPACGGRQFGDGLCYFGEHSFFVGSREWGNASNEFVEYQASVFIWGHCGQAAVCRVQLISGRDAHGARFWYVEIAAAIVVHGWSAVPRVDGPRAP